MALVETEIDGRKIEVEDGLTILQAAERLDLGVEPPVCEMMVVDDGPEFDPLAAAEPDRSLGIEDTMAAEETIEIPDLLGLMGGKGEAAPDGGRAP